MAPSRQAGSPERPGRRATTAQRATGPFAILRRMPGTHGIGHDDTRRAWTIALWIVAPFGRLRALIYRRR